jgi:hypothetical protein
MYGQPRKFGVGQNELQLWEQNLPTWPTAHELARELNVGWEYAAKFTSDIHLHDAEIIDQAEIRLVRAPETANQAGQLSISSHNHTSRGPSHATEKSGTSPRHGPGSI